jgi:glutathione peroxidase-family protein
MQQFLGQARGQMKNWPILQLKYRNTFQTFGKIDVNVKMRIPYLHILKVKLLRITGKTSNGILPSFLSVVKALWFIAMSQLLTQ